MSETVELNFDNVHSHELSAKQLERLAKEQWKRGIRKSRGPNTKYPYAYPEVSIEDRVDQFEKRIVKLAERVTSILETMLIRLGKLEAKLDEKMDELDLRLISIGELNKTSE